MVYEDYTSYTEVDTANNRIQVTTNHIDHLTTRNEDTYVYSDKGVDHFGDFTHLVDFKMALDAGTYTWGFPWGLTNNINDYAGLYSASQTFITIMVGFWTGTTWYILIRETVGGTLYDSGVYSAASGTMYYLTITKSGTSITCKIYSDSARTNLLSTLSLTLQADHTFRYIFASSCWNSGHSGRSLVMDIDNLDLQEAVALKPSSSIVPIMEGIGMLATKSKSILKPFTSRMPKFSPRIIT